MPCVAGSRRCIARNGSLSLRCTIQIRISSIPSWTTISRVTADDIKNAVARYVDVDNRVVLDIIPAPAAEAAEEATGFRFATAAGRSTSTCCTAPTGSGSTRAGA